MLNEMFELLKSLDRKQDSMQKVLTKLAPELYRSEMEGKREDEEEGVSLYDPQLNVASGQRIAPYEGSGFHYPGPISDPPGSEGESEDGDREQKPFPETEPAIPMNHTTPAHRMLKWAGIAKHVINIMKDPKIKNIHYPINREVRRGVIRLYSRGEGSSRSHNIDKDSTVVERIPRSLDNTISTPEASASPDTMSDWGFLNSTGTSGANNDVIYYHKTEVFKGGLNSAGTDLDVDESTVRRLAKKYMDSMNIMHPIISPPAMEGYIRQFLKDAPDSKQRPRNSQASFVKDSESAPLKRKRSVEPPASPTVTSSNARWVRRSINTAIMLIVLALGKICEHQDAMPDVVPDTDGLGGGTTSLRNGYPSPTNMSPVISPQVPSGPSPKDGLDGRSPARRGSVGPSHLPPKINAALKNRDVIPGLAYFAEATNIIGNQLGGITLQHVHVNILACLYHGQLARVAESYAYIQTANRALYSLLKPYVHCKTQSSGLYKLTIPL